MAKELPETIGSHDDLSRSGINLNKNDVLLGYGNKLYDTIGNRRFRILLDFYTERYTKASEKNEKLSIPNHLVQGIRHASPPGRFLKKNRKDGLWIDINDKEAIAKVVKYLKKIAETENFHKRKNDVTEHLPKEHERLSSASRNLQNPTFANLFLAQQKIFKELVDFQFAEEDTNKIKGEQ